MSEEQTGAVKLPIPTELGYILYFPPDYDADPAKKWPLVFFLHGAGERGNDPEIVKFHGLPKEIDQGKHFPFIMVAPQCPLEERWPQQLEKLDALFDTITQNYRVDLDRVYLTGLSLGGNGTWFWTTTHPDRFAAAVPICGRSYPEKAGLIKDLPLWVFHGVLDPIVPLVESTKMVEALRAVGSDVKLTVYPDIEHDSWSVTYANPELYDWLLSHHR
ncbi:MAG: prolyl oligopeptidase family serine peptidase [Chloroflexi bacterium]|nr:prolyl oligopeptidase family serine peptidase [Chloroflexota bacterium]OJV94159.1 MAG: phospholipase [Chloroflexi bacterium 54-19]